MSFVSIEFLIFLFVLAGLYKVVPASWRYAFLLVSSYLFYISAGLRATELLVGATLFTYVVGVGISKWNDRSFGKSAFILALACLCVYLIFFKILAVLPKHGGASWIMPLGLSYYTFKLIGYLLDVHWGKIIAEKRLIAFAAYIVFFPQIVAGPIQREDFLSQPLRSDVSASAVLRIAWGIAKKVIIADHLGLAVDYVFSHVSGSNTPLWLGFYLWPLQLYADFSGLTDIAIGAGSLFGITGPENFNRPFTASSISDYWRRWHMSLTTWLVDYLFTPLRMSTRNAGNVGLVFSITVNMLAIGLWHGLTWGYFVFGAMHSVFLSVDALSMRMRRKWFKTHPEVEGLGSWLGWLLTFHLVAFALVFFRARTVADGWLLVRGMLSSAHAGIGNLAQFSPQMSKTLIVGVAGYVVLELGERFRPDRWALQMYRTGPRFARWSLCASTVLLIVFGLLLLLASGGKSNSPFVYAIY